MIEKLFEIIKKYKELLTYGIFGVLTTVINIVTYTVLYNQMGVSNIVSNVIAWILSVLFAYVTNKIWVFESKSTELSVLVREMISFFGCRLATGIMDIIIMYVAVDMMALNSTLMKCASNVLVIVANYVFSKLIIFKNK